MQVFGLRLQRFHHRVERQNKDLFIDLDRHAVEDSERQRQQNTNRGPFARPGMDFNVTAHLLDVPFHDVHADAAARDVGHLFRGRKARRENEHSDLFITHAVADRQPLRRRFGENFFAIEPGAVIDHFDADIAALMFSGQNEIAHLRLTCRQTGLRIFNTVVEAITHQVG